MVGQKITRNERQVIGSIVHRLALSVINATKMKSPVIIMVLCAAVMVVMVAQVMRQELSLRRLERHMVRSSEDVKTKEKAIIQARAKVDGLKTELRTVNNKLEELKKGKADTEKSLQEHDKTLEACNSEKVRDTHTHTYSAHSLCVHT